MVRAKAAEFETKDTGHDAWWLLREADREAMSSGLGGYTQEEYEEMRRRSQFRYERYFLGRSHATLSRYDDWTKVREQILASSGYSKMISKQILYRSNSITCHPFPATTHQYSGHPASTSSLHALNPPSICFTPIGAS
jgi:hypothetical protein